MGPKQLTAETLTTGLGVKNINFVLVALATTLLVSSQDERWSVKVQVSIVSMKVCPQRRKRHHP